MEYFIMNSLKQAYHLDLLQLLFYYVGSEKQVTLTFLHLPENLHILVNSSVFFLGLSSKPYRKRVSVCDNVHYKGHFWSVLCTFPMKQGGAYYLQKSWEKNMVMGFLYCCFCYFYVIHVRTSLQETKSNSP